MKILIAEDDFTSRSILLRMLGEWGECEVAVDGEEALTVFKESFGTGEAYQLLCLDIMMPKLSGQEVLQKIRAFEKLNSVKPEDSVKVIMTTALGDSETVIDAFKNGCESYVVKPIAKQLLFEEIKRLGFES